MSLGHDLFPGSRCSASPSRSEGCGGSGVVGRHGTEVAFALLIPLSRVRISPVDEPEREEVEPREGKDHDGLQSGENGHEEVVGGLELPVAVGRGVGVVGLPVLHQIDQEVGD